MFNVRFDTMTFNSGSIHPNNANIVQQRSLFNKWLVDEPFRMPTSYFQCFIRYRLTMHKQYMTLLLVSTVFIDNVKRTHTLLFYYYHGRRFSRTNHVDTRKLRLIRIKFNT